MLDKLVCWCIFTHLVLWIFIFENVEEKMRSNIRKTNVYILWGVRPYCISMNILNRIYHICQNVYIYSQVLSWWRICFNFIFRSLQRQFSIYFESLITDWLNKIKIVNLIWYMFNKEIIIESVLIAPIVSVIIASKSTVYIY